MLRRQNVTFGVWHQAQHAPGRVAKTRDVALRAIRVDRVAARCAVGVAVSQDHLSGLFQPVKNPRGPAHEPALAVGDWQGESVGSLEERTLPRRYLQAD